MQKLIKKGILSVLAIGFTFFCIGGQMNVAEASTAGEERRLCAKSITQDQRLLEFLKYKSHNSGTNHYECQITD